MYKAVMFVLGDTQRSSQSESIDFQLTVRLLNSGRFATDAPPMAYKHYAQKHLKGIDFVVLQRVVLCVCAMVCQIVP